MLERGWRQHGPFLQIIMPQTPIEALFRFGIFPVSLSLSRSIPPTPSPELQSPEACT